MRGPSFTARGVAHARQRLPRPQLPQGDVEGSTLLERDIQTPFPLTKSTTFSRYIAARTAFFDEQLLAVAASGDCQVVILGAGYDDRALRFRADHIRFVEVDHPRTQRDKIARLQRLGVDIGHITFLPVDFTHANIRSSLANTLVDDVPTLLLSEGLLPYLAREVVESLLCHAASCPGTRRHLAVEVPIRPTTRRGRVAVRMLGLATAATGEPIRTVFATRVAAEGTLASCGWDIERWNPGSDLGMPTVTRDLGYVHATA